MKKVVFFLSIGMLLLGAAALVLAQDALPSAADLPEGEWTAIDAGGDTICSNGTPYSFFARRNAGTPDKVMVYFQGGGACWFGDICDLTVNPTYDPFVDESDVPPPSGIFDFDNEANPFADYHVVFVPYCTGDVHIGNATRTYESSAGEVEIFHNGFNNSMATLDWTFANVPDPSTVVVAGSSAGAIPSPFYAEFVAEAYPDARIEVIADAAGGYRTPENSVATFGSWGTPDILTDLYEGYTAENLTFEAFYIEVGKAYPDISMTQYNTAFDETQIGFLALSNIFGADLPALLEANFADISAEVETFAHYLAGGELHTILLRPELYTYTVGDVALTDWLAGIEAGDEIETVACEDCTEAEVIE